MENPIIISNLNDFIFCPAISTVVDICVQTAARGVYKPYLISTVVDFDRIGVDTFVYKPYLISTVVDRWSSTSFS